MMATPAPPILVERMQSVQKKEEILFASVSLDFQGWLSTCARDPPNQQENQDQLFSKAPATRSVCSQLMQKAQKDTTVTALETDGSLGNTKSPAAMTEEPITSNVTHSDLREIQQNQQFWPLTAAVHGYLASALENVGGGMSVTK